MSMFNLDDLAKKKADVVAKINQAMKDNDETAFQEAFVEYTDILQQAVMAEAKGLVNSVDNQVLTGRGVRALTSEETKYYQQLIQVMQQSGKEGIDGFEGVLPETVIDAIFEDITEEHPLLSIINFQNASVMIKYLYSTMDSRHLAFWGPLCGTIVKQLQAEFKLLNLEETKLSAFLPICKAMLDLGPAWLDRYVRAILAEAISNGLEDGIINGKGLAPEATDPVIQQPIGMTRDLTSFSTSTGYGAKTAQPIANFLPETYLNLIADLVKVPIPKGGARQEDLYRRVTEVTLIVNPVDYLTKIIPSTIYRQPDGKYVSEIFPFPTRVVQSAYVAENKAVLGLPERYLMALGVGDKGGRIEYSDEYRFLEDERVYLIKLYGTGRPLDNNSFIVLDITNVQPIVPSVKVVSWPDATLKKLEVYGGGTAAANKLTLTPGFDKYKHYFAGAYDAAGVATGKLVIEAADADAVVTATLNGNAIANLASITWSEGQNVVVVTVKNGTVTEVYVAVVTYTDTTPGG